MAEYGNRFNRSYGSGGGAATGDGQAAGGQGGGGGYQGGGNRGGYQGGNKGGYQGGGGGGGWKGKGGFGGNQQPIDPDPYIPVVFFSNAEPPLDIKNKFKELSEKFKDLKFTVRVAGGNTEADDAARDNAGEKMEEYLPWKGFESRESAFQFSDDSSIEQACKFHPAADKMKDAAKKFLSRNLRMVQGKTLKSPAKFIILWSEDGAARLADKTFKTGNAGHFLSIAAGTKTPVFNLGKAGTFEKLMEFITPEKEPEYKPAGQGGGGFNNQNRQQGNPNQGNSNYQNNQNSSRDEMREPRDARPSRDDDFDDIEGY